MPHRVESQPHSCGYDDLRSFIPFALITVAAPARASGLRFRLTTPRSIWHRSVGRFSPFLALCTTVTMLTRPLHSLYLFILIDYKGFICFVKDEFEVFTCVRTLSPPNPGSLTAFPREPKIIIFVQVNFEV